MIQTSNMQDKFNQLFPIKRRLFWVSNTGIIGLLFGLFVSHDAWSTTRTYPLSPVLENFTLPGELQTIFFILAVITLGFSLFTSKLRRVAISLATLSLFTLVLLDITRLQPWILHYLAIIFLASSFVVRNTSTSSLLDTARIVIVGMYFWSGIQKINLRFFSEIFPWFTESLWQSFGETGVYLMLFAGLLVPLIEIFIAMGLLTRRFRKVSILGSFLMLTVVLLSVGPFGQNWNSSIWPWNVALFTMVVLLFFGTDFNLKSFSLRLKKNYLAWLFIFIFWIMPAGNFIGLTDHYLSWSLYSGKVPEASIQADQTFLESLSPTAKDGELRLVSWALQDLNLVPYPETRVFLDVFEQLCAENSSQPMSLKIEEFSLKNEVSESLYACNQI